jgi:mRNA interferase RelE/StbE
MDPARKQWKVEIHRLAEKGIKKLPRDVIASVWAKIKSLADDPCPAGSKPVQGFKDTYRLRVGDFRIVYAILEDKLLVLVLEVSPRGAAYKDRY